MERFEVVKDIGQGNFGTAKLLRDKNTGELFAVKYIDRGPKVRWNTDRFFCSVRSIRLSMMILMMNNDDDDGNGFDGGDDDDDGDDFDR
jgi:hypothetical protein